MGGAGAVARRAIAERYPSIPSRKQDGYRFAQPILRSSLWTATSAQASSERHDDEQGAADQDEDMVMLSAADCERPVEAAEDARDSMIAGRSRKAIEADELETLTSARRRSCWPPRVRLAFGARSAA
jgi:hypothetical protein